MGDPKNTPDLLSVCQATLLFHKSGGWNAEDAAEWTRLTGHKDASTKDLCDAIRAAIAKLETP
jgi:hypothetical protein